MPDEATIRIIVHRQNIHRYKFLLETRLTELERAFITRRIAEEEGEVRRLTAYRSELAADARANDAPLNAAIDASLVGVDGSLIELPEDVGDLKA